MKKETLKADYSYENCVLTAVLTAEDNSQKFIHIILRDMIFVCDFNLQRLHELDLQELQELDWQELEKLAGSVETYDLTDCCAYWLDSDYAKDIADAMTWLINKYITD